MKTILLFAVTAITLNLSAQNFSSQDPNYITNVQLGEEALKNEKYDSCLTYYSEAFKIKQTSVLSTLRMAACAYSKGDMDLYKKQVDIAFGIDWGTSKGIFEGYPEFEYLQETSMESDILERYSSEAKAAGLDLELMEEFALIAESDQKQRREMGPISDKYGWESPQMDSLWKIQSYHDSLNTLRITQIIDEMGYPGKSIVGPQYQGTAFLVIQHADHETQVKYLPIITAAADAGEVRWSSVALLVDRVRQGEGKPQIYGSQVSRDPDTEEFFFGEIEQPYKVDSLRAEVGLGPLNDYAKNWNFSYDPDKHVERHRKKNDKK